MRVSSFCLSVCLSVCLSHSVRFIIVNKSHMVQKFGCNMPNLVKFVKLLLLAILKNLYYAKSNKVVLRCKQGTPYMKWYSIQLIVHMIDDE